MTTIQTRWPRVYLVEDQEADRRALRAALVNSGVTTADIAEFQSYDQAWEAFANALKHQPNSQFGNNTEMTAEEVTKNRAKGAGRAQPGRKAEALKGSRIPTPNLPALIIADIGLRDEVKNGLALLGNAYRAAVNATEAGLWTIAVTAHPLDVIGQEKPCIPHMLLQKTPRVQTWTRDCALAASPLLRSKLASDGPSNDLAPTLGVPPSERIYLYERGDATNSNEDPEGPQFDGYFDLGLIQPCNRDLRAVQNPILMYRGRYVELSKQSLGKLPRVLLRSRAVLKARREDVPVVEIASCDRYGVLEDVASSRGIPVSSLANFFTWLRTSPGVSALLERIFGRPIAMTIPPLRESKGWITPKQVFLNSPEGGGVNRRLNDAWKNGHMLRCPPDFQQPDDNDGFWSRLQFVLTDEEVSNFTSWKASWKAATGLFEAFR